MASTEPPSGNGCSRNSSMPTWSSQPFLGFRQLSPHWHLNFNWSITLELKQSQKNLQFILNSSNTNFPFGSMVSSRQCLIGVPALEAGNKTTIGEGVERVECLASLRALADSNPTEPGRGWARIEKIVPSVIAKLVAGYRNLGLLLLQSQTNSGAHSQAALLWLIKEAGEQCLLKSQLLCDYFQVRLKWASVRTNLNRYCITQQELSPNSSPLQNAQPPWWDVFANYQTCSGWLWYCWTCRNNLASKPVQLEQRPDRKIPKSGKKTG